VPRANDEGNIGTALKNWLKGWFKDLTVAGAISGALNGTVGVTTPAVGAFTTLSATGNVTLSTHLVGGDGTTNPTNLLTNGNFELWSAGTSSAPDGWTLGGASASVAREGTIIKTGTYSAALTRSGTDCYIYQQIHAEKGIDYWKGKTITFGCWMYATVADRVGMYITGGTGNTFSSRQSGSSTWEWITVSRVIPSNATYIQLHLNIQGGDTTAYFDGVIAVEGAMPYAFSPKPLPRGGTITAETDETKFSHKIPVDIDGTLYYVMLTQT